MIIFASCYETIYTHGGIGPAAPSGGRGPGAAENKQEEPGNQGEEIEYNSDGQKWRKRFEIGPDGKVARELVYDHHNRLQTYKTFEWNEFGKKKAQYTYNAKGKLLSIKHYEYIAQDAGE